MITNKQMIREEVSSTTNYVAYKVGSVFNVIKDNLHRENSDVENVLKNIILLESI